MIRINRLKDSDVGRWVIYDNEYNREKGRIKSWNDKFIFVVYNCADDWDGFKNYTACATDPYDLSFNEPDLFTQ